MQQKWVILVCFKWGKYSFKYSVYQQFVYYKYFGVQNLNWPSKRWSGGWLADTMLLSISCDGASFMFWLTWLWPEYDFRLLSAIFAGDMNFICHHYSILPLNLPWQMLCVCVCVKKWCWKSNSHLSTFFILIN